MNASATDVLIRRCIFTRNVTDTAVISEASSGGASCIEVVDCLFVGNEADFVLFACFGAIRSINCTFVDSDLLWVFLDGQGTMVVRNAVVWANRLKVGIGFAFVQYSDIQGGFSGTGNIDADPMFVDPDGGDFRLMPGSPCIDAGSNAAVPEDIETDLDGNPRFVDDPATPDTGSGKPPLVDMGSYEFQIVASCPADLDGSGAVDFGDVLAILTAWGNAGGPEDLDDSGLVDFGDILVVLSSWGPCA